MIVSGSTISGKSTRVWRILHDWKNVINIEPRERRLRVLWCFSEHQDLFKRSTGPSLSIDFQQGLTETEEIEQQKPDVIVIDDLMAEVADSKQLANLFTKKAHHLNISLIFIVQNLYFKGKQMTTVARNTHYTILFNNRCDVIWSLAKQVCLGNTKAFYEIYKRALRRKWGYLLIDTRPGSDERLQFRTRICLDESPYEFVSPIVYTIETVEK